MGEQSHTEFDRRHDPFGWLKTTGLVVVLGGAMYLSAVALAKADTACAPGCRSQHNACRLDTKGHARCDSDLQACVNRCIAARSSTAAATPKTGTIELPASASSLVSNPRR